MSYDDDGDVREPLEIPRETLIATLQDSLDAEKAEREEKNAAAIEAMEEFKAFLADHADEVAGYVANSLGFSNWTTSLQQVERFFEDRDFTPKAIRPTVKENALEKYVRVLSLATNKAINVVPDDDLYPLL